jgi:GNAT superfamily N-acetyltransferase
LSDGYPWPVKPNVEHLATTWRQLESLGKTRTYVLVIDEKVVGIFLGLIVPDMITGELQGLEYMWFVEPQFRGTRKAVKMLRAFEGECKKAKCVRVLCGLAEWLNPEEMRVRYSRMGYAPHSAVFTKELK